MTASTLAEKIRVQQAINIAVAGYGMIGRVHALNYAELPFLYPGVIPRPMLHTVCTSSVTCAKKAAQEGKFAHWTDSVDEMLENPDIDVIDVSLPNSMHKDVVIKALKAGKSVYCEKPLAGTAEEARVMAQAVNQEQGVLGMVFQYRFFPAILKAKELLDKGHLGKIFTWRAEYLHTGYQNPQRPMSWKMRKEEGGAGALGDLGSHVIDLVRYLLGDFAEVQGLMETFIKERPVSAGSTEMGKVSVDDVVWFHARMANGSVGTLEASRFATGTMDDLHLAIYGEKGALRFDLMDPNFLYHFDESRKTGTYGGERGWIRYETAQYYPGAKAPPARAPIGWIRSHAENQHAFLHAVAMGQQPKPGISDGLQTQLVMDAVERSAEQNGIWTTVDTE